MTDLTTIHAKNRRILDVLDQFTPDGDFNPSDVAERAFKFLREEEPELLDAWLHEYALSFIKEAYRSMLRSKRAHLRHRLKAASFQALAENGDAALYEVSYLIDDEGTRRRLADMTASDHLFVAEKYEKTARNSMMLAAFHRAVAKRIGDQRTADVLTEAELQRLYASVQKF